MAVMKSYELNGKKLSFANWISNLSPTETPFSSMTGKEAVDQTIFRWQIDRLSPAKSNAVVEGSDVGVVDTGQAFPPAQGSDMGTTTVKYNYTQILRKSFKVSDTANALANYGRGRELAYQMEKFSLGLKRDLESILLSAQGASVGNADSIRHTACYQALVAEKKSATVATTGQDPDTGAYTHFETAKANTLEIGDIQEMTYNLYLANSDANVIMFHPKHARFFSLLQGDQARGTTKMFDGDDTTFSQYVNTYIDEFGRSYKLVPNRWMPENAIYFFNPSDFTQMILRAPEKIQLAKKGNYQHWMLEMEVGLRLRDPWAAGALIIK